MPGGKRLVVALGVGEDLQRAADERQAIAARNMRKSAPWGRRDFSRAVRRLSCDHDQSHSPEVRPWCDHNVGPPIRGIP